MKSKSSILRTRAKASRLCILCILLLILLSVSALTVGATDFAGYTAIGTADELLALMADSDAWGEKYYLTADIVLPEGSAQSPIGVSASKAFKGVFDGNGHSISGVALNGTHLVGLFGVIDGATIQNLTVEGSVTGTGNNVGGIVGFAYMNSTVKNCTADVSVSGTGGNSIGGVVGKVGGATVGTFVLENCTNNGNVNGKLYTGGIIGLDQHTGAASTTTITGCKNYGTVTGASSCTGGILGYYWVSVPSVFELSQCANYGDIQGAGFTGGVLGAHIDANSAGKYAIESSLSELYNCGAVSGTAATTGGVVGSYQMTSIEGMMTIRDLMHAGESASLAVFGKVSGSVPAALTHLYNSVGDTLVGTASETVTFDGCVTAGGDTSVLTGDAWTETEDGVMLTKFYTPKVHRDTVYVRDGASGDGSQSNPVGSLPDAFEILNGAGGQIILLGTVSESTSFTVPEQAKDLTITAEENGCLALAADFTFEKNINENTITLDLPIRVVGDSAAIFGGFNSVVFGEHTTVDGTLDFYGGVDAAVNATLGLGDLDANAENNRAAITELPYSITVENGTFRYFAGGNRRSGRTALIGAIAGELTVTINGGTFGTDVSFTADSPIKAGQAFSLSGMSILAADATLNVNGGVFNVPVYAQGNLGEVRTNASAGSQVTKSDRSYFAIDGDIVFNISGGRFDGCEISASQTSSVYTQLLRGNFALHIGEGATLGAGMTLDATQVKAYVGESAIALLTYPAEAEVVVRRFDLVNGEAQTYEEPLRIVCIGDSITEGSGTTKSQETESYPAQLLAYLNGEGASLVDNRDVILSNFGCSGTRVMNYSGQWYNDTLAYTLATEEADPDFAIIGLGTNDAGYLATGKGQIEHFRTLYTDLLSTFGNIPGIQQVYATTATYRAGSYGYGAVTARGVQKAVVDALSENSDKYTCIDLYALTLDKALNGGFLSSDNLHPDAAGYGVYKDVLVDAIFRGNCAAENFELTNLYVSDSGTNNALCSAENPTNNLSIAIAKAAPDAVIHIVDTYTCTLPGSQFAVVLPAVNSLTLRGEGENPALIINGKYLLSQSELVLDNFTMTTTAGGSIMLQMGYYNATLTETFSVPLTHKPMFCAGYVAFNGSEADTYYNTAESVSADRDCEIRVLGGSYSYFLGGNYCYRDGAPFGTYGGNMTLYIGKNVEIGGLDYSGIVGMNYLTGTVTAQVDAWAEDAAIYEYATRGAVQAAGFNVAKNTGTVSVTLGDEVTNELVVMGDFDGDLQLTMRDTLILLKHLLNNSFDQSENYFAKTTVSLLDVIVSLKRLAR